MTEFDSEKFAMPHLKRLYLHLLLRPHNKVLCRKYENCEKLITALELVNHDWLNVIGNTFKIYKMHYNTTCWNIVTVHKNNLTCELRKYLTKRYWWNI